jgi:hypothetical protein
MRPIPQTSIPNPNGTVPAAHAPGGSSGSIGGATADPTRGVRRDFTYTPLFNPALTTNGQTGVPRG